MLPPSYKNNTEYSTRLFTTEAEGIIARHAQAAREAGAPAAPPLFLYLPYQAVHVGNKPTPSHPEYAHYPLPPHYAFVLPL